MTVVYQSVDAPSKYFSGTDFNGPVRVVGNPTYGRVLFMTHGVTFDGCRFRMPIELATDEPMLTIEANCVTVRGCVFGRPSESRFRTLLQIN